MDDLVRTARIIDAASQTVSYPQPLFFHLGERENPTVVDDSMPPSKRETTDVPRTDDKPLRGSVG